MVPHPVVDDGGLLRPRVLDEPRVPVHGGAADGRAQRRGRPPGVRVPTLIVAGEKDPFTPPAVAWEMHREIRGSEILVVPNGTHVAQVEHPDLVALRIEKFLSDHGILSSGPPRPAAARRAPANGRARAASGRARRARRAPAPRRPSRPASSAS
ncbi:MAG: alpha/beta hydrolase [Deltaproteobacteria bacterium]|nr:alpha/beta hydrolase [Deltaproteobacteria bacterium]